MHTVQRALLGRRLFYDQRAALNIVGNEEIKSSVIRFGPNVVHRCQKVPIGRCDRCIHGKLRTVDDLYRVDARVDARLNKRSDDRIYHRVDAIEIYGFYTELSKH